MKQTAVEWLVEQICGDHTEQWQKEIEQTKQMEKQQIVDAYVYGSAYGIDFDKGLSPINYYKETYESNT
jgi:hypothetical protein